MGVVSPLSSDGAGADEVVYALPWDCHRHGAGASSSYNNHGAEVGRNSSPPSLLFQPNPLILTGASGAGDTGSRRRDSFRTARRAPAPLQVEDVGVWRDVVPFSFSLVQPRTRPFEYPLWANEFEAAVGQLQAEFPNSWGILAHTIWESLSESRGPDRVPVQISDGYNESSGRLEFLEDGGRGSAGGSSLSGRGGSTDREDGVGGLKSGQGHGKRTDDEDVLLRLGKTGGGRPLQREGEVFTLFAAPPPGHGAREDWFDLPAASIDEDIQKKIDAAKAVDFNKKVLVKYNVGGTRADYPITFRNPQAFLLTFFIGSCSHEIQKILEHRVPRAYEIQCGDLGTIFVYSSHICRTIDEFSPVLLGNLGLCEVVRCPSDQVQ